jgi:DNA invertase Pin-like site-specific DNA recombinase
MERELREVASRMGCEIVRVYKDHGISGAKGRHGRPDFDRLLRDAAQRKFGMVMAWSVARLGRSLQDLVSFLSELHALHIDLFLHQQGLDTATPAGKSHVSDDGRGCRVCARDAERVRAGLRRAKDEGKQLGRPRILPSWRNEFQTALNERKRTGEGVRGIAKRFGVDPSTMQGISRPFVGVVA